ncbi:hypothetical protein [Flavobacterium litorale]|uniref:Uncharacterized protein n=1 Tax=Flavobacterium litorale TaxID=2856519 RepID=A0ABX8V8X7_9FLAO|nr:hypothetical protein [Flavobacterium litorale]QYJ68972.1 hypothetical protein K1I41_03550 [Flavobacterium litorale]
MVFLFSCSENNDVETSNQSLEIEKALSDYNDAFFNSSTPRPKLSVKKLQQIISADFEAASFESIYYSEYPPNGSTAAWASYAVGRPNENGDIDIPPPMHGDFNVIYEVPEEFVETSDIGQQHNDFLSNVFFGDTAMEDYLVDTYGEEFLVHYNSDAYQNNKNIAIEVTNAYIEGDYGPSYLSTAYREHGLISENVRVVLSLFSEAFFETSSDSEITAILEYYSQTVYESNELTHSDKVALFSAFSVARSSSNYWNNFEN